MDEKLNEMIKAEKEADLVIIEELEKTIYDYKNLMEIGISLSSNLNFSSLVDSILYSCIGQMFIEKVAILLQVDIDKNSFYIHNSKGYSSDFTKNRNIIIDETSPLIPYLESHPYPQEYEELLQLDSVSEELKKLEVLQPELIVPLKSKNTLNGILLLGSKILGDKYKREEKEFLKNLSRFSSTAVENSRLYLMATHDRLTRLFTHHHFQERLLEEISRSIRYDIPLSLFLSDIDFFKKFNDSYGHQVGDAVLKETADLMKQTVRSMDIPARYGGEEFVVILPETEAGKAYSVAERYRKNVENMDFFAADKPIHVTISIGVAQFNPSIDKDKKAFIDRVDKALYRAKETGRNRVVQG